MPIEIKQLIRSTRKTVALIVEADGSLTVRAPLRASEQKIMEFVERSRAWIEKKQREARSAPPSRRQYIAGETFPYLGVDYPLQVVKEQRQALTLEEGFRLAEFARTEAGHVFQNWYRKRARAVIRERVEFFASSYGFQYQKIRISSARTRWGSCSSNGTLSFSWRLIMNPMEMVDYVVVHELVHTVFHNHSKRFWRKVEKVLPDYKERNRWLRKHAQTLI